MGILDRRDTYAPFEYQTAHDYWLKQQQSHWLHTEISLSSDLTDWNQNLTDSEKEVIQRTLKGFVQTEVFIEDYWSTKVTRWFPKPEIQRMASAFASFETIHAVSYAYLQETLGMTDFDAFLHEPSAKAKIDRLISTTDENSEEIALSLAIFSAFNEGVNLFSSFAILMSFGMRDVLKGMGQIIALSVRDESLHAEAGCWLFRALTSEYPSIVTPEVERKLYEAAELTVQLEDKFINQSFSLGDIPSISSYDLKQYIRFRTNTKLEDINLNPIYRDLDSEALTRLEWFDVLASGEELQDFFAGRVTTYAKATADFSEIWE